MEHAQIQEENKNSSLENKSDSETLSKTLDEIDLSSNSFLDFENFSKFYEEFSGQIKETVSSSTKIPIKPNEFEYYLTCPSFKSFLQTQNDRILKLMGNLLKQQNIKKSNICSNKLDDDERMDLLIDTNDQMIEKLGIQLDEIQGLRKKTETELKLTTTPLNVTSKNINTSWNKDVGMVVNKSLFQSLQSNQNMSAHATKNPDNQNQSFQGITSIKTMIQKPQRLFEDKIDNSYLPFVPKIRKKPNALRPLPEIFEKIEKQNVSINEELFNSNLELLENPYAYEIEQFEPSEINLNLIKVELPSPLEETNFKYIDDLQSLIWLCEYLGKDNRSKIKEIAVDMEHHSYRSFLGFTCLLQISTRHDDFLIDTLKLRSEMHRLNEVFTDWTLTKIMHGADMDIEWLQKDFGIYVVNMFDTGQAARILQYPHFSLSYLLQRFCNVTAQKQYQLADWRTRPLSEAMIRYAREDTHYLLYIYDELRNELIKQQMSQPMSLEITQFKLVYEKSKLICKKIFRKPIFYSKGFLNLCQHNSHLNAKQTKALHDLYTWRDKIARESDESCEYVLKSHQLLKIAELLPREIYGILALCNPISSLLESNVHEIHEIIKVAREYKGTSTSIELGLNLTDTEKNLNSLINKVPMLGLNNSNVLDINLKEANQKVSTSVLDTIAHAVAYDPDHILNCPHDLSHNLKYESELTDDSRQMITNTNALEEATTFKLEDLLIRKNEQTTLLSKLSSPLGLNFTQNSKLRTIFKKYDSNTRFDSINSKKNLKTLQKLKEKIELIKSSMKNPFEMFLPLEFRSNKFEIVKWNLLKTEEVKTKPFILEKNISLVSKEEQSPDKNDTFNMIPLKQQFKHEKYRIDKKHSKSKALKNVDFTNIITEYNNSKVEKVYALGSKDLEEDEEIQSVDINTQQQQLNNLIASKISSNLKSLSESVKSSNGGETSQASSKKPFSYDPQSMDQLFAKPTNKKGEYDPSARIKRVQFNKVNKRRSTNALTRNKQNQSVTFKKD